MSQRFKKGQKVKVVQDHEDPASEWVGATGVVRHYNAFDNDYTIRITSGNPNPEDGNLAWFSYDELEAQQ